ncbi:glycosyltransferase family 2 protein [Agrilutibacter solisilvae]|uniref:Glycosyltransferase family 2 protein n=1 Tax=Agrilutibacter solisilvae TaxID=2763317 RepID=A0A974Y5R3_9GAMM|nr:glycosyltransferase family 2 protein [Lysobacter solisilvae]QSX78946.1 glycosyltransferase family 2 protein [Lysobacter solisilvae]
MAAPDKTAATTAAPAAASTAAAPATTRFSVIVTCYNYKAFVEEAVDSALAQTHAPAQVIVVDDGSTDGSTELLRARYGDDERVTLLCGPNGGQLAAFVRGVEAATGEVLCFLDADDRWEPGYLQQLAAVYDTRPDVGFVFSDIHLFGQETRRIGYADRAIDLGYTAIATYALTHWYGAPTSALSLRRACAQRCLDLPADQARIWRLSADNCLVYGASVLGARKYFLPTGCVGYRIHGNNGWWSKRSATNNYHNRLASRALIAHYARVAGIDESCLELTRLEYRTKPDPGWDETKRYATLALRGQAPWWKRLERALSVLSTRRRKRRGSQRG